MANVLLFVHSTTSHETFCLDTWRRRRLAGPGATPFAILQTVRSYGRGVVHGGRAANVPRASRKSRPAVCVGASAAAWRDRKRHQFVWPAAGMEHLVPLSHGRRSTTKPRELRQLSP